MRFAASNVGEAVVAGSEHWIMEENPKTMIDLVRTFLIERKSPAGHSAMLRRPSDEERLQLCSTTSRA